jgi:hypothetical protein
MRWRPRSARWPLRLTTSPQRCSCPLLPTPAAKSTHADRPARVSQAANIGATNTFRCPTRFRGNGVRRADGERWREAALTGLDLRRRLPNGRLSFRGSGSGSGSSSGLQHRRRASAATGNPRASKPDALVAVSGARAAAATTVDLHRWRLGWCGADPSGAERPNGARRALPLDAPEAAATAPWPLCTSTGSLDDYVHTAPLVLASARVLANGGQSAASECCIDGAEGQPVARAGPRGCWFSDPCVSSGGGGPRWRGVEVSPCWQQLESGQADAAHRSGYLRSAL